MDSVGAVVGPLIAVGLVAGGADIRTVIEIAVLPGIATVVLLRSSLRTAVAWGAGMATVRMVQGVLFGMAHISLHHLELGKRYVQDQPLDWGVAVDRKPQDLDAWCAPGTTRSK